MISLTLYLFHCSISVRLNPAVVPHST